MALVPRALAQMRCSVFLAAQPSTHVLLSLSVVPLVACPELLRFRLAAKLCAARHACAARAEYPVWMSLAGPGGHVADTHSWIAVLRLSPERLLLSLSACTLTLGKCGAMCTFAYIYLD